MLVKVFGSAVFGVEATTITVEVNIDKGVGYHLVGLPDNAIKESSYRIAAALKNNGYSLPGKKITINMAPADLLGLVKFHNFIDDLVLHADLHIHAKLCTKGQA